MLRIHCSLNDNLAYFDKLGLFSLPFSKRFLLYLDKESLGYLGFLICPHAISYGATSNHTFV